MMAVMVALTVSIVFYVGVCDYTNGSHKPMMNSHMTL